MAKKINVEDLQLRVWQLDGELETIRDRIRQYGLRKFLKRNPKPRTMKNVQTKSSPRSMH